MKFLLLSLAVLILLTVTARAQKEFSELEKLEIQLKMLDNLDEKADFDVDVKKENEKSGKVIIAADIFQRQTILVQPGVKDSRIFKSKSTKVDFPEIDLSEIEITDEYIDAKLKAAASASTENRLCGSIPGIRIAQVGVTRDYVIEEDYTYPYLKSDIKAVKGFVYDRASIPRILWAILDKDALGNVAPLFHDMLYRSGGALPQSQVNPYRKYSREETDKLFLELMTKCGVSPVRRELAYQAVRKFGKGSWQGENP